MFALLTAVVTAFSTPGSPALSSASATEIYEKELDKIPHVVFWRRIMNLHKDSCLVNVHQSRTVIATMHAGIWYGYSPEQKQKFIDSFRLVNKIADTPRIVGTMGKSFFYAFEKVAADVPRGIRAFENNGVDGWYAKAILLIESPNRLQKSTAGAYGPFQLMPGVARNYGLRVNRKKDERANFDRSAYAASQLIKTICIPYARQILSDKGIPFREEDLGFKLFVMHIYNAGAGNVRTAVDAIPNPESGMGLIMQLWNTSAGRFKSSSQNYSQLILAAFLEYENRVEKKSAKG